MGKDPFGVGIADGEEGGYFPFHGFRGGDVVTDLDVDFLLIVHGNEVYLFLIEFSYVDAISPAEEFEGCHVFIESAIVHVSFPQASKAEACIDHVVFLDGIQVFLSFNVVSLHAIEKEGSTEVFYVVGNGDVVCFGLAADEGVCDFVGGDEISYVVQKVVRCLEEDGVIPESIFLPEVSRDDGIKDACDIAVPVLFFFVDVGACHASLKGVFLKAFVQVLIFVVCTVFGEAEGQYMDFKVSTCKEGGEVAGEHEGIGAGDVNIVGAFGMEAVDGFFEVSAQLDFIDKDVVVDSRFCSGNKVPVEGMVFLQFFVFQVHEVYVHDVSFGVRFLKVGNIGFQEF